MSVYIISVDSTSYIKSTVLPLIFTDKVNKAFEFISLKAGKSYLTFLENQGVSTLGFHLGQKPPK